MVKAFAVVMSADRPVNGIELRAKEAMMLAGWQLGIIRARRQFADDDRKAALEAAALGNEHTALSLHSQADQHEAAMIAACAELGRITREQKGAAR